MKYFTSSFVFTLFCLICAVLWANYTNTSILSVLFVVLTLGVLEVSLSFDNAVVNTAKLEKMTPVWQKRFLSWGIIIAVFGMRFLFPLVIVSIFSKLNLLSVLNMALNNPDEYTKYLTLSHSQVVTFGAGFLIMLFFTYFFNSKKSSHWLGFIEKKLARLDRIPFLPLILTVILLFIQGRFLLLQNQWNVFFAGLYGVITFIVIEEISKFLEKKEEQRDKKLNLEHSCFINFLYLELIDASFSLDGVLGAFALSKDVVVITLGLAIGAMFVRSLTVMLTEKKTLKQYIYLENGAHWAIGVLAVIMFISAFHEVSEIISGFSGLILIVASLVSSIKRNK